MDRWLEWVLTRIAVLPDAVYYLVLGAMAGLENLVPPIPADVVVLFGSFLAQRTGAPPLGVFVAVWIGNVGGALLVYALGRRYGDGFFRGRWGEHLLRPKQFDALALFYRRYGPGVIFVSRFLPLFRAVVPAFAGVAGVGFWRTALPIGVASAAWYGFLVWLGTTAGRSWESLVALLGLAGRWLWVAALVVIAGVVWWWLRSR